MKQLVLVAQTEDYRKFLKSKGIPYINNQYVQITKAQDINGFYAGKNANSELIIVNKNKADDLDKARGDEFKMVMITAATKFGFDLKAVKV